MYSIYGPTSDANFHILRPILCGIPSLLSFSKWVRVLRNTIQEPTINLWCSSNLIPSNFIAFRVPPMIVLKLYLKMWSYYFPKLRTVLRWLKVMEVTNIQNLLFVRIHKTFKLNLEPSMLHHTISLSKRFSIFWIWAPTTK